MCYVLDSGRVDEDLSNSRLSLAVLSELRPIVADPCVVVEFAAFGKQMHRRIHETFAAREDREQGVTSDGRTSSGFGVPGPGIYDQLTVLVHRNLDAELGVWRRPLRRVRPEPPAVRRQSSFASLVLGDLGTKVLRDNGGQ